MATRTKAKARKAPTNPLRCSKCRGTTIKVGRAQQMLRRTFRRDSEQRPHLHANCVCQNPHCGHEWWSAHQTAVSVSKRLDKEGKDSEVIGPTPTEH